MTQNRLENKIFWLVMIPLIISFAVLVILGIDKETRELFKQEHRRLTILSKAMRQSITNSMLLDGPHRLGHLLDDFRHLGEVETVSILSAEGRYALVKELGSFGPPIQGGGSGEGQRFGPAQRAPISQHPAFAKVLAYKTPRDFQQVIKGQPTYTALVPLLNKEGCQRCHSGASQVIGVLQVSTSLQETKEEIHSIKFRLIFSSVLSVFIIGALLRWLLKAFVLRPINEVVSTIREVAAGDLSRQVRVESPDEVGQLASDFNRMAASLRRSQDELREWNIRLDQEVKMQTADLKVANLKLEAQQERIRRDLKLAEKVQMNLIPPPLVLDGLEVGVTYIPHLEIGGDAAEILAVDDRRAYVACFDVTGHGIAAALVSNSIQGEVRRLMREGASPGEILIRLNSFIDVRQLHLRSFRPGGGDPHLRRRRPPRPHTLEGRRRGGRDPGDLGTSARHLRGYGRFGLPGDYRIPRARRPGCFLHRWGGGSLRREPRYAGPRGIKADRGPIRRQFS
jgi:HAMP domain-containing protein